MLANGDLARLVIPLATGLSVGLERGWQQRAARPGGRAGLSLLLAAPAMLAGFALAAPLLVAAIAGHP